jgi:hypothetical protein
MVLRAAEKLQGRPADMAAHRRRPVNRANLPLHPAALLRAVKLLNLRRLRRKGVGRLHSRRPLHLPLLRAVAAPLQALLHQVPVLRDKVRASLRLGQAVDKPPRRVVRQPARMPHRNATACLRTSRWRNPRRSRQILRRVMCRRRRARATKKICPSPTIVRRRRPKAVLREQPLEERRHPVAVHRRLQRVVQEHRQAAPCLRQAVPLLRYRTVALRRLLSPDLRVQHRLHPPQQARARPLLAARVSQVEAAERRKLMEALKLRSRRWALQWMAPSR